MSTKSPSFDPDWQVSVKVDGESCIAEMAIPFSALKVSAQTSGTAWRANFCRNRFAADPKGQSMCWSPTYGSFHTPIRFGRVVFSGEVR